MTIIALLLFDKYEYIISHDNQQIRKDIRNKIDNLCDININKLQQNKQVSSIQSTNYNIISGD